MYPLTCSPPTVYISGTNPDHAEYMQYYWWSPENVGPLVSGRTLDVVNVDTLDDSLVPKTLPCVMSYADDNETKVMYGEEAIQFLTTYLKWSKTFTKTTTDDNDPRRDPRQDAF